MTQAEHTLLMLLRAWLAHRRSGWTHRDACFDCLCIFVDSSLWVFVGISPTEARYAVDALQGLLIRDFGTDYLPFNGWDGHDNPARVAWVRKVIQELESKQ